MKKFSASEKVSFAICFVVFILFISAAVLAAVLFGILDSTEEAYSSYRSDAEIRLSELEKEKNRGQVRLSELTDQLSLAEKTRSELESRIGQTEAEIAKLKHSFENKDELYRDLNEQLTKLRAELLEKETEIAALKQDIGELEKVYGIDINQQYALIAELERLLREEAPMNRYEGNGGTSVETDGAQDDVGYVYPNVSVYYEDLERGYHYRWQSDKVFGLAGCAEAPFALSVLMAASEEQADYDRKLAEYIAQNGVVDVLPNYQRKYDFSTFFTYAEQHYRPGAGIIKDEEFGVQYTHRELFGLLLQYGDSIAYAALKAEYGTALVQTMAKDLGLTVMRNNLLQGTATELGTVMRSIYRFTESDATYAAYMKEKMTESVHTVMIGYGVAPKKVAHTFGWDTDAYHDMAIVYDEHPYVLVILTDMDRGGDEVNAFIQKIASTVDDLHETFYTNGSTGLRP